MKKFNKNLAISIPQDPTGINQGEQNVESNAYLQFTEEQQSENGENKKDDSKKIVQFQEFDVGNFHKSNEQNTNPKARKNIFKGSNIEIEEQNNQYENIYKQPQVPCKPTTREKFFVFPPQKQHSKQQSIQQIKQLFQCQRQQFYKEKSKLQREILIKNGQIDMLQKIVKEKYSDRSKFSQIQEYETILLEKDIEINELLEKIKYLNQLLSRKTQSLNKQMYQNSALQSIIESLKNQLYVFEKKQKNYQTTKKFFLSSQSEQYIGGDFRMKELQHLQNRIQMIKMNRMQLNRKKIKQGQSGSLTTKNKNKIPFEFRGKAYDRQKKFNQTGIY